MWLDIKHHVYLLKPLIFFQREFPIRKNNSFYLHTINAKGIRILIIAVYKRLFFCSTFIFIKHQSKLYKLNNSLWESINYSINLA